jgi:hypothetical protein
MVGRAFDVFVDFRFHVAPLAFVFIAMGNFRIVVVLGTSAAAPLVRV